MLNKKSKDMKFHYTYRITNIKDGMHYYGARSSDCSPKEDIGFKYFSSSTNKEFKVDQKKNPQYYKYKVIKIFETRIKANDHEIMLHAKFNVKNNTKFYNESNSINSKFGYSTNMTEKIKMQISNKLKGIPKKPFTSEHRHNIGITKLGNTYSKNRVMTDETRKKISESKIGNTYRKGIKHSAETKKKMKESQKNRTDKRVCNEETKKKIGLYNKDNIVVVDIKNNINVRIKTYEFDSKIHRYMREGHILSEESIEKMKDTMNKNKIICRHCNKLVRLCDHSRWHGDNCKQKDS